MLIVSVLIIWFRAFRKDGKKMLFFEVSDMAHFRQTHQRAK